MIYVNSQDKYQNFLLLKSSEKIFNALFCWAWQICTGITRFFTQDLVDFDGSNLAVPM